MPQDIKLQTFFQLGITELKIIRARYGRYLLIAGACSAAADIFTWSQGENFGFLGFSIAAALILGWTYLVYSITALAMGARLSILGFTKYALTGALLLAPFAIGFGLLLFSAAYKNMALLALGILLTLSGWFFIAVMQGWPLMQTMNRKITGPLAAFKSTRGFRLPLVLAGFIIGGFNRGLPSLAPDASIYLAVPHALVGGFIVFVFTMVSATLAVTSAKLMLQQS